MFASVMLGFIDAPILMFGLVFAVIPIWFLWVALNRAGLAGPLALLCLVPLGFLIPLGMLAFAEWPALHKQSTPQ
jgi:hypothetical protein